MKIDIEIKLKNPDVCDGCSMLELSGIGWNYHSKCHHPKNYDVERISLTRWEVWKKYKIAMGHPDLIGRFETTRPKKCKKENGT